MKTKQVKEELDRSTEEDTLEINTKTRSRKRAQETEDSSKAAPEVEQKASKEKKNVAKPKPVGKNRPLGVRKTLRNKKPLPNKDKLKNVIKQTTKRGRKATIKTDPTQSSSQEKDSIPLIQPVDIKTEPLEESTSNSRSSSPKTSGRRQRLSSDIVMMKSVLSDSPNNLVIGPRTSPYSMRSERSNSPSMVDGKNLRSAKPRKLKNNLLNEVVKNEQKKRRRLLSDSKTDNSEVVDDGKKKRGRSCSRDGSEISKCSDITESDVSLTEAADDCRPDRELIKTKTDVDVVNNESIQISTDLEKVPLEILSKNDKSEMESTSTINKDTKKTSLKRSTSLDSDNNNSSNRFKLAGVRNSTSVDAATIIKTEKDALINARSSILTSMSKTFNSKEVSKNIRKARRGRKAAALSKPHSAQIKNGPTIQNDMENSELEQETLESLSNEIEDLISTLDDDKLSVDDTSSTTTEEKSADTGIQTKSVSKFYGIPEIKPLSDSNANTSTQETKEKEPLSLNNIMSPSKSDNTENIRLRYEEDSNTGEPTEKKDTDISYKHGTVASIDKLMDRLKEFEEFDKRRQQSELQKSSETKSVMVTNDVVLIPKSGADIKPLKDIQTARSPEKPLEKENVLSCFENNSAISIVKRDQVRKSLDIDLPNSVTLIKRNSVHSRKESTGSNHSRESGDAISIFEKSLGKDVTLTEIRKSVDKPSPLVVDVHQLATLHPNVPSPSILGVVIDSNQISITPRVPEQKLDKKELLLRKSSESAVELELEKMATLEKIKPPIPIKSPTLPTAPVAIKSPEAQQIDTEALAPPLDNIKTIPDIAMTSETVLQNTETDVDMKLEDPKPEPKEENQEMKETDLKAEESKTPPKEVDPPKAKVISKPKTRQSIENQAGPSNTLAETPESQKRKENILRTLGLLTHKAANEAKIEKQKEKERMYAKTFGAGLMKNKAKITQDYTGTLKTVIKLNKNSGEREKKKYRSSLKMTFQKSKHRSGKPALEVGEAASDDEAYYTIERKEQIGNTGDAGHRKSHSNRLNHDAVSSEPNNVEVPAEPEPKEALNLVIPEKASSFSIHPGRLCMDQCFYCGGKFGLFDTPCHLAQMKSSERRKKVLDNEEKLTIDSCLCDACYRHVDRRANCPSYRKRPAKTPANNSTAAQQLDADKLSPTVYESSEESQATTSANNSINNGRSAVCHTEGCLTAADHSIRRKWLIKMRSSVNKVLKLQLDYPGLHTIPLCASHYKVLSPLMACTLCRRRLTKHHNIHFINHGYLEVSSQLATLGIPVQFTERPVLCELCRYYCSLLMKPGQDDERVNAYTNRLLQLYNVEGRPESDNDAAEKSLEGDLNITKKKKGKTKSKQRKSSEPTKSGEDAPEMETSHDKTDTSPIKPMEEDIESLISSNKILVPSKPSSEERSLSDGSDPENMMDLEGPVIPRDKQTELQYLLQKQNNPAQFLQKPIPNLALAKSLKGVPKTSIQQKLHDKNAKKLQKIGQVVLKDKQQQIEEEKRETALLKNLGLNEECTIESIPNKRPADINTLKNKWQMSESFTQVKKNISELSKQKDTKKGDQKFSNPVKRLETNPSISVRELFPGEEEMNLQCNIEFSNVKGTTPEGWEKCSTTIQYDPDTRKLWTELQRPYGNQSSFLRHLVLLEKYFRNGDLVLAQNATLGAANYSDTVQNRLRAYDNVPSERRNEPAISLIEYRKKPSVNGKSLLKTSQEKKTSPTFKPKKPDKQKRQLPPELIAINTPNAQGRKAIQNVLHNIQQLVKGVSASDPTEVASAPLPPPKFDPPKFDQPKFDSPKFDPPKFDAPVVDTPPKADTPKVDSPKSYGIKKKKTTSKPWRPTLMPITQENLVKIAREPRQLAVDGRSMPALVQVISSGKRYHITLQDYNKMCVMRKEKLQQTQKKPDEVDVQNAILGNGGTVKVADEKPDIDISANAATILKNVGLRNITIAPIPAKTATVTSHTLSTSTSPLVVTSTPIKLPQFGAVSITSETVLTPNVTPMPKIPKSLTVIPQTVAIPLPLTVPSLPQSTTITPHTNTEP